MGSELDNMAFRSILVAIAIIVAGVHAVPMPNDIVPETKFVEGAATSVHAAANQIVTEMIQAGRDWTSCEELANSTREEVTDAVKTTQKLLDSADKGCSCAGLGQDEVNRTLNEMNAAWIMTDAAYLSAYAIYTKAVNTLATARKTYALSVIAHKEAVTEAARLKLECECATQSAHATAWAEANEDNDANAAAWAQAHHIDCVVQSISEANCVFGPAPGLTKPTLCDDIESVSCAAESGSAQHVPADEAPVYICGVPTADERAGMPNCGGQEAIATLIEGRTGSSGEQCFTYSCPIGPCLQLDDSVIEGSTNEFGGYGEVYYATSEMAACGYRHSVRQHAVKVVFEGRTGPNGEVCYTYSCPSSALTPPPSAPPTQPTPPPSAPIEADSSKECVLESEEELSCAHSESAAAEHKTGPLTCWISAAHADQPNKALAIWGTSMTCACNVGPPGKLVAALDAITKKRVLLKPRCDKPGCTYDCKTTLVAN